MQHFYKLHQAEIAKKIKKKLSNILGISFLTVRKKKVSISFWNAQHLFYLLNKANKIHEEL